MRERSAVNVSRELDHFMMMDQAELACQLMGIFLDELDEHIATLDRHFRALQLGDGDPGESIASVFRAAHGLRGAARVVGQSVLSDAFHQFETLLAEVRSGQRAVTPSLCALGLEAAQMLAHACERLRAGQTLEGAPVVDLATRVSDFVTRDQSETTLHADSDQSRFVMTPLQSGVAIGTASYSPAANRDPAKTGGASTGAPSRPEGIASPSEGYESFIVTRKKVAAVAAAAAEFDAIAAWVPQALAATEQLATLTTTDTSAASAPTEETQRLLKFIASTLADHQRHAAEQCARLRSVVAGLTTLEFSHACLGLPELARHTARRLGKQVEIHFEGSAVELDAQVLEQLREPLVQLVKNAVVHGIEKTYERETSGKPVVGRVDVMAEIVGEFIHIRVVDDGQGLEPSRLIELAQKYEIECTTAQQSLIDLIFRPGFSTLADVTDLAGHGFGLGEVRRQAQLLGGVVTVEPGAHCGVSVVITVPAGRTSIR